MTRFFNKKEQQNNSQGSFSFLHYLLLIIIIMEFIRFPNVPSTEFRPVYIVVYICLLIIIFNFKKLPTISPIVIKIISLLLFYDVYTYLLAWGLDILDEKQVDMYTVVPSIKKFIEFLVFSIACTNLAELKRVLFTITIAIFISAVFGLLIYHFGEPFQGIRDWLWQSKTGFLSVDKGGKGQFVTGLSGTHWLFGYLMTVGPAIALICGRLSRFKWLWTVIFSVMCYALYLNGERAAFFFSCLAVVALVIHWRLASIPSICIGITFVLSIYIFNPSSAQTVSIYHTSDEELSLIDRFQHSGHDSKDRFLLWKAGILSVMKSPWIGPVHQEYISSVSGDETVIVVGNPDRRETFTHNSYINPGMYIGIIGWFIVLCYLAMLKKILTQVFTVATKEKQEKIIFEGVSITLLAPMLNAMFQNDSIFTGEATNVCLTGLLISCCQIAYNQNAAKFNYHISKTKYA